MIIAIHLDLYESKEHSILNEFLFSFLITKFYSNNENIIYIPKNIEIYIEIPNCFENFIKNYEILDSFEKEEIKLDNIPELKLDEKMIKLLDNMKDLNDNKKIFNWLKTLLNEELKMKKYSYHQINIFLKLFICQYNKFEGEKLTFFEKGENVTDKCIKSFALGTRYFINGGFSKLLLGEIDDKELEINNNEDYIDLLSKVYKNDLKKENFKDKLIFIVENLKIYYNLDISSNALREYKDSIDYLKKLKKILNLKNPVKIEDISKMKSNKLKSLYEIIKKDNYVITNDNFRKMILILYRIIANIPVILMGETGCGKTALLKKLNQLLNNGKETLKIINIDPSYTDDKIIKEMNEKIIEAKEEKIENIWLFFDEINTCDSLPLITEIFIKRSYNGIKFDENIRLMGACNPYRKRKKDKNVCGLSHPNYENDLIYLVNLLPQSLMYYVFNFGSIDEKDEKLYIESIINDLFIEKNEERLKKETKNVISECHNYLRNKFDPSVVSLREMSRFKKCCNFFIEFYKKKKQYILESHKFKNSESNKLGNPEADKLKSIIISIYLCYYIRLIDSRTTFESDLDKHLKNLVNCNTPCSEEEDKESNSVIRGPLKEDLINNYKITKLKNFSEILLAEQDFLLNCIDMDKGIGKNKSLKENIFLLFTALVTNIPLIIIGKPGSGKSLSAQIMYKSMRGKYSKNEFFKLLPSIIQSYFQGSNTTTPEDVEGIFQIAEGKLISLREKGENISLHISLILFDELGLAERSKFNPLKVLHNKLEYDGTKQGVSFVGISNWRLDAAKLNRALFLSVPDLDELRDDLKNTSINIAKSINEDFSKEIIFDEILPGVYFDYKNILKELKILTVYKKYEIEKYKDIINRYKFDKDLLKNVFEIEKIEEESNIYGYDKFKEVKNKLINFLEEKKEFKFFDIEDIKVIEKQPEYIKLFKTDKTIDIDFHGNRDFYYIIKGIANDLNENNENIIETTEKYIERNFGGLDIEFDFENDFEFTDFEYKEFLKGFVNKKKISSTSFFKQIYNNNCEKYNQTKMMIKPQNIDNYNYVKNIIDNIKDNKSRYLLLEIKPSLASLIHQKIKKEMRKKDINFYEGSPFVNDLSKDYQFKIINKIQEHAGNGDKIILQNLNQVYPFLYDLFNMNYTIKDGKKYVRICHGNFTDQLTLVKESFRVIIMVDKKFLDKVEPPFLNRFEKMIFSFKKLVNKNQSDLAQNILNELNLKKLIPNLDYKINYELKDLLIGCKKEDILGIIYYEQNNYENKETLKEKDNEDEKIKEKVLKKIYKLLPQDIIFNLDNENLLRKKYISLKEYYNLLTYLNSNTKYISIIYTFSTIFGIINEIDESSCFKTISQIKSETELRSNIDSLIKNKNNHKKNTNLIIIQFDQSNSNKLSFVVSFVENNYKNTNLKFIFIIHIKRNFFLQQTKGQKFDKIYAISDVNDNINQLFIDNLNGENIKINDILSNPIKSLLESGVLKIEKEFRKSLRQFVYNNLTKLYGDDEEIDLDNYLYKLEKFLENESSFMDIIIKKIDTFINEEKENQINIIKSIYEKKMINKSSIDLISVIIDYIKNEVISKYISKILENLEDNNILTTLLVINGKEELLSNDIITEIMEKYLNNIKIEEDKEFKPKFILNYIVPGFYNFYESISKFISSNVSTDFMRNEKKLRMFLKGEKDEAKKIYHQKEEIYLSLTYNEVQNYEFISEFIYKIPSDLILNDYITFFLIKYNSDDQDLKNMLNYYGISYNDCKHKLICLLLDLRFNERKEIFINNKNDQMKLLLMKINWLEANYSYIIRIVKIFNLLKNIFKENELFEKIEEVIKKENLRYITNEKKNPDITTEVNECYYLLLAAICYSIIPPNINFNNIEIYYYFDILKGVLKNIQYLNDDLYTFLNEIYIIDELVHIYDVLEFNNKLNEDVLNELSINLKRNNVILQSNEEIQSDQLIQEFSNTYKLLNKSLNDKDKKYFQLLKYIFFKEIKKIPNVKYRTAIFEKIIKYNEIIIQSNDILQILLFPLVNPNKIKFWNSIIEILNATDYDIANIIENLLENPEQGNYIALSETLLYYFEKNSLINFHNIFHDKEKILFENDQEKPKDHPPYGPLKLFKECVKYLNKYLNEIKKLNNKNKNICKLFCIGYIKSFCYTFINLIESCSPNLEDVSKIIKEINKGGTMKEIIKLYIYKIIYNKNYKSIDAFKNDKIIKRYKLEDYEGFKEFIKNQEENPFKYKYINSKSENIRFYKPFNSALEKYKFSKFENIKLEDFNLNKVGIDIFYFSTINLILPYLKSSEFLGSQIFRNFYKNVCCPLFKSKEKIFSIIQLLYNPDKFKKMKNDYQITSKHLDFLLYSFRYCINELYYYSSDSLYGILYSNSNFSKINKYFYPGNDIKNSPIYDIYSKIENHFKEVPNQGCFVCLCSNGGYYHSIKGGIPGPKHLDLKCKSCGEKIGSFKNERGFIMPIKRENYFRILKTQEEKDKEAERNLGNYFCMSLDEFKENYIYKKYREEKGISKSTEEFFKKDSKIIRFLSQVSYRILNFILYSHLFFSRVYNNNKELNQYLPTNMSWMKILSGCWQLLKNELNKIGISSIEIFMNYIFSDLFSVLNQRKTIKFYNTFIDFESKLEKLIQDKIIEFKNDYQNFNNVKDIDRNNNFFCENLLDERYREFKDKEYPFLEFFYYSDYINEEYLLDKLYYLERDKYPLLLKILEEKQSKKNNNKYSLKKLSMFNEVLNLFDEKYSHLITRDNAEKITLSDEDEEGVYYKNKGLVKDFIKFYNSLKIEDSEGNIITLSEKNKLSNFFIVDDNEIGKSYKMIYYKFIERQNEEISSLLDIKIEKGIFDKDCKNEMNIQNANNNDIFITDLPDKFSFIEVVFNNSYRKVAIDKDYNSYNNIQINLNNIENRLTELLLKNKKLFNKEINNFVYKNEDLSFENINIITKFNEEYQIENLNINDKKILYLFYDETKEDENLYKTIFNDFIQIIIFLNHNIFLMKNENKNAIYIKENNKISDIFKNLEDKISTKFKDNFKDKESFLISKITNLFEYYRNLVFGTIKREFINYQIPVDETKIEKIKDFFKTQRLINSKNFNYAIRSLISLFLFSENDKENKIKNNRNNFANYLNIPDIWDKSIYRNREFNQKLKEIKNLNIQMNQILSIYDNLGDEINDEYFSDVLLQIKKDEDIEKQKLEKEEEELRQENKERNLVYEEDVKNKENNVEDDDEEDDDSYDKKDNEYYDDGGREYV